MDDPIPIDRPSRSPVEVIRGIEIPGDDQTAAQPDGLTETRRVLEEFVPVTRCLEWRLSSSYWATAGLRPFVEGAVPSTIHNSGWAAHGAAAVLFASCVESDSGGPIRVLELGAGLGLFAKQLLDRFRDVCREQDRDFYGRLTYVITDGSKATVDQWASLGVFEEHGQHAVIGWCDASQPQCVQTVEGRDVAVDSVRAVFMNYLLDSLPAAVVRFGDGRVEQLLVRTYWPSKLDPVTGWGDDEMTFDRAAALAEVDDPKRLAALLGVMDDLEYETTFGLDGAEALAGVEDLGAFVGDTRGRATLNYEAVACLKQCLDLLGPGGFVLVNDLGPGRVEDIGEMSMVQRYGNSVCVSVNFPYLEHVLDGWGWSSIKPERDDERSVHSRVFLRGGDDASEAIRVTFLDRFAYERFFVAMSTSQQAAEHIAAGRYDEALGCYRRGIESCPEDWHLLALAAQFLTQQLGRFSEALDLARTAARINPWSSCLVWNTLGNCYFCLGASLLAHEAFMKAFGIYSADPQTHLNLSHTWLDRGDVSRALQAAVRGLEHDTHGHFREHLLQQQGRILQRLDEQRGTRQMAIDARNRAHGAG